MSTISDFIAVATISDFNRLLSSPTKGPLARDLLRKWGYDADRIHELPQKKLGKLLKKLLSESRRPRSVDDTYSAALKSIEEERTGKTMSDDEFNEMHEREKLHVALRSWCRGPLTVERPQGSSLHMLVQYDIDQCGKMREAAAKQGLIYSRDIQNIVVENDWGAAVPPMRGEWRLPFPITCWEFRLSGVRVLAIVDASDEKKVLMFMVYGRDGRWVVDDYNYRLDTSGVGIAGTPHSPGPGTYEFRAVARKVHDCIRASCIMIDAEVARREVVTASSKLRESRLRENRAPPRDHYVVRLMGTRKKYIGHSDAHGKETRAQQRGHWRQGTWVHFDDQDSGRVQYVNDGGFIVSKTWRRWHFAGDPNNIIHKEFRL